MFFAQHELGKPRYFAYSDFDEYKDFQKILNNENLIVHLSKSNCSPCYTMTGNFNQLVYMKDDDIFLHTIEEKELANKFQIEKYPYFNIF